ncbi:hypothetical protein NM208_g2960 [Fusarium decemcellulare]|uniref:Uncharacterized protein n=1 Tax=Fusarium decemcellulare TaxID=57161 RepID=A0ACC1SR35_9HYPO|nr:hypothetical protein NM208_g2960 [Fusarium decemcellulare]
MCLVNHRQLTNPQKAGLEPRTNAVVQLRDGRERSIRLIVFNNDGPSTPTPSVEPPSLTLGDVIPEATESELADTSTPGPEDLGSSFVHVDYDGSESAMGIARKIYRLDGRGIDEYTTSAIPDGGSRPRPHQGKVDDKRMPIPVIMGGRFPEREMVNLLLEDYFQTVHWFSLVVYEPKFRQCLSAFDDGHALPSDEPFLALLSMMLCMAAWYRSQSAAQVDAEEWRLWSCDLLRIVESRLIMLMDQRSIPAVQACILLGSHHVYHGRPNLSFSLLGATIKMSHAMGLHRDTRRGAPGDFEERKRVWWTIYTWDRFASISYGRPLSINDEDCRVEMPAEFVESPYFTQESIKQGLPGTVYSSYQTELSKLYLIASPALKSIFGSLSVRSADQRFESQFASLVSQVTHKLVAWRHSLPQHLSLDLDKDYNTMDAKCSGIAHGLQSLSLQLTFDNLMIVLHRPFLSRQISQLSSKPPNGHATQTDTPLTQTQSPYSISQGDNLSSHSGSSPGWEKDASSEHWWSAAVRTARVTELPQLAQSAADSHLVAFMAMNLFHAAIVLISVALADPLSDSAQGIKRTITRVFRLQELLGQRSSLSSQSSMVLKNLINLLLQREGEAMLGPVTPAPKTTQSHVGEERNSAPDPDLMSVQDTLRLPLEAVLATPNERAAGQVWHSVGMAQRLNESLASVQRSKYPQLS